VFCIISDVLSKTRCPKKNWEQPRLLRLPSHIRAPPDSPDAGMKASEDGRAASEDG